MNKIHDINYELYKVFYHVAVTLSFSEASNSFLSPNLPSAVHQGSGKKAEPDPFYPQHQARPAHPEGEILFKHVEPSDEPYRKGLKSAS